MLYLDLAQNREDFIFEKEDKYPYWIQKILCFIRRLRGQPLIHQIDERKVVVLPKFNKKIAKKLDKIFQIDVTKNVCISEKLKENIEFVNYLKERNLNIMDGKWLFGYLVPDIAQYVCTKLSSVPEEQEVAILVDEINFLVFEIVKKMSYHFKNITIVTNKIRKFDKLEKEIYEENGLMLNITNNYKKACLNSKIVFNFNFDEKEFNKVRFLPNCVVINLEKKIEVNQSNFKGKNIDFYTIDLPMKYRTIYKKMNNFNSSILYESFIYKKTSIQNIWNEIQKDKIHIIALETQEKVVNFANE